MVSFGRPTVRDIARHAGVSVATVSRVTSNDPRVAAETRSRVLASVAVLGYRPSALGRGLASGRHNTLGVVLPSLGGPYFAELIVGAEAAAIEAGLTLSVLGTHLRPDADEAVRQLASRADGILVLGGTVGRAVLAGLSTQQPVVVIADVVPGLASVRTDGRAATAELTEHLLNTHGYRALRFVGLADGSPDVTGRYAGFRDALAAHGLVESAPPLRHGMDSSGGATAARELAASGALPQALVCANDELAIGLLATLPGLGLAVPSAIAIVGFDDSAIAALASPALTTVEQPIWAMGRDAARIVIQAAGRSEPLAAEDLVLPTRLVIRESCGCVLGAAQPD